MLAAVFLAGITGGTTLTFDASLPWVYHEVYLWQTALVIAAAYWLVRTALEPSGRGVAWLGLVALCAVLTRTTGGWGVCVGAIALGVWMWRGRSLAGSFPGARRLAPWVLAAGLLPLAVGVAYNMVKFGHPYLFPLQDQVWTGANQHRRFALESNGGTITGPQFFTSSLSTYFDPRGIRFVDYFPWVTLPGQNATGTGARRDRPVLPDRQRDGVHAAVAADGGRLAARAAPAYAGRCGRPGRARTAPGRARDVPDDRRGDGLRLSRPPLHQ